jgi:hypothetical protein
MGRVLQRLAVAVGSGAVLLLLVQCNLRQKPGDKCSSPNKYQCTDTSTALLCANSVLVAMPCRGQNGCQGVGAAAECDDTLGVAGDACTMGAGQDNIACSTDHKSELICTGNKWTVNSTCKGPGACKFTAIGTNVNFKCDDDFADLQDPCVSSPGNANYSCTPDKKTMVVCTSNKFVEAEPCRGAKGCYIETNEVYCDTSMAKEGEMCRHADAHACSDDSLSMLHCTAQLKWAKQNDCKRSGCKVKGHELDCN